MAFWIHGQKHQFSTRHHKIFVHCLWWLINALLLLEITCIVFAYCSDSITYQPVIQSYCPIVTLSNCYIVYCPIVIFYIVQLLYCLIVYFLLSYCLLSHRSIVFLSCCLIVPLPCAFVLFPTLTFNCLSSLQ